MFWGLVLKPNKRYSQTVSKPFRVSHASLDVYGEDLSEDDFVQVWVHTDDTSHLLCNLTKATSHTLLDVAFSEKETIAFFTKGSGHVHLTGNLIPEDPDFGFDGFGEEEEEEDEDVSDEELKLKSNDKPKQNAAKPKKGKQAQQAEDEDEDEGDDDDDDGDDDELNESELLDVNEDSDEDEDDDDDEEDDDEDDSDEETEVVEPPAKVAKVDKQKLANGLPNGKGPKDENKKQKDQKKAQKPQQQQTQQQPQQQKIPNQQQKQQPQQGQKKTLSGGVVVEDLRVGKGPEAKHGKKVQVYYEGRLKSNNKVFDSTKGGEGFKFTLGRGEVIRGWDIGVAGMKVGSKRRITCPANVAYGAKGSPPVIPANATLLFDVELRGVN